MADGRRLWRVFRNTAYFFWTLLMLFNVMGLLGLLPSWTNQSDVYYTINASILAMWILSFIILGIRPFLDQRRTEKEREKEKERRTKERDDEERRRIMEAERKAQSERAQMEKGLVKFVDINGNERWAPPEQVTEWRKVDLDIRNNFERLGPYEFEEFVRDLFIKMGYQAELTGRPADYGVDILARKGSRIIAVQVKKYAKGNLVPPEVVRGTLGSMGKCNANKAIIVTSSDFTERAYEQAEGEPIELWNNEILVQLVERYYLPKIEDDRS